MKRRVFLFLSFGVLGLFIASQVIRYIYFLITDPSNALHSKNWISLIFICAYFGLSYFIVFFRFKIGTESWPPIRCYSLFGLSLLTTHSPPLLGSHVVRAYITVCIVIDILFLLRMIAGRIRKEKGWDWQIYAVAYIWLTPLLSSIAVDFVV